MCIFLSYWSLSQSNTGRLHHAVGHLRGQLNEAVAHVETLEAELKNQTGKRTAYIKTSDKENVSQQIKVLFLLLVLRVMR